jgi:cation diffusion facilitator family transporter
MPEIKNLTCPHDHKYLSDRHHIHERRTWFVIILTSTTMILEIVSGLAFGSMALLADGWHMASHASAMGLTALAYYLAKRYQEDKRFTFGTGKIGDLGGFSSALILALIALLMAYESIKRLFSPIDIAFNEAIAVAFIGLTVNLISALILKEEPGLHNNGSVDISHHHDHNLRAAYLHVLADALTSILAIIALVFGRIWGFVFLDPLMGIVGAVVISIWAYGLLRQTAFVLLDMNHGHLDNRIREIIKEQDKDSVIYDLHVWRLGPGHYSAIISLETTNQFTPEDFKSRLCHLPELSHVSIEIYHSQSNP